MRQYIKVREYRKADHEACCGLWVELAKHHADIYRDSSIVRDDTGQAFDEYMGRVDRCGTWVAESNGTVIGTAGLLKSREMLEGEIEPVIVTASFRNRGIGTRLVKYVVEEAKRRGMRFLKVRPVARNKEAISLYVRLGFNLLGYVDLFQDLKPEYNREWKPGIEIHGNQLRY